MTSPREALERALGRIDVWRGTSDNDPEGYWDALDPDEAADLALDALSSAGYAVVPATSAPAEEPS
jgi:hypothetical protein